ncbi:MafI family immunity protein [Cellulomonas massiliensis]|uniref:MafI family immunity protein n=1 Tax=Cellulomonas massiliensis TaxID=1465811 RepID=UPI00158806E5|nr:MafI family immunity protein [Cellulomonas massiliensis]
MQRLRWAVVGAEVRGLPHRDVANVLDYLDAGEGQVGMELLCTQLYEYDVALPVAEIEELEDLGRLLSVDPELTEALRENAAPS